MVNYFAHCKGEYSKSMMHPLSFSNNILNIISLLFICHLETRIFPVDHTTKIENFSIVISQLWKNVSNRTDHIYY